MIFIMIISGLLSSMYVWAEKWSDVRISINDLYMIGLMTGYMIFFMSLFGREWAIAALSAAFVAIILYAIRTQAFVSRNQYYKGMIPHHSMAVFMSRKLLESNPALKEEETRFLRNVIATQSAEIDWMKMRQ